MGEVISHPAFTPQLQSITALWLVLISCPTWDMRLSWPWWLGEIPRWYVTAGLLFYGCYAVQPVLVDTLS